MICIIKFALITYKGWKKSLNYGLSAGKQGDDDKATISYSSTNTKQEVQVGKIIFERIPNLYE